MKSWNHERKMSQMMKVNGICIIRLLYKHTSVKRRDEGAGKYWTFLLLTFSHFLAIRMRKYYFEVELIFILIEFFLFPLNSVRLSCVSVNFIFKSRINKYFCNSGEFYLLNYLFIFVELPQQQENSEQRLKWTQFIQNLKLPSRFTITRWYLKELWSFSQNSCVDVKVHEKLIL